MVANVKNNMNKKTIIDLLNQTRKTKDKLSQCIYEDLLSRIGNLEIAKKVNELSSDEIISILKKMASEREESLSIFEKNNKIDLAKIEKDELAIIRNHLPKMMSYDETLIIVDQTLTKLGTTSKKLMGNIIKNIKESYGTTVDMKILSVILNSKLT